MSEPQIREIKDVAHAKDSVSVAKREYLSISHIQSAALLARLVAKIESTYIERSEELFFQHRTYVIAAIFFSVSFLEATINELFADTVDNGEKATQLDPNTKILMANMWKLEIPRTARFSILEKFQIALTLASKEMFEKGKSPYQDAALLITLRNSLVHYEPEWAVTTFSENKPEAVTIQKFANELRGKFSLNPMTGEADTFFPDRCLSHGCAQWAVHSSLEFADQFFAKMNLPIQYQHVRSRLTTE